MLGGGGVHSEEMAGHIQKLEPKQIAVWTIFLCRVVCGQLGFSGLQIGGITFGGLGMKDHPDGSLVRNIFKGSFTEGVTVIGKDILEGGFKFSVS